jgi:hypothetical protein
MLGSLYLSSVVRIDPDVSKRLLEAVTGQYGPLMGAILGFYFAGRKATFVGKKGEAWPFYLAIGASVLWNLVAVVSVLRACRDPDKSPDAVDDISTVAPTFSWLVAGAMIYFYGKSPEAQK